MNLATIPSFPSHLRAHNRMKWSSVVLSGRASVHRKPCHDVTSDTIFAFIHLQKCNWSAGEASRYITWPKSRHRDEYTKQQIHSYLVSIFSVTCQKGVCLEFGAGKTFRRQDEGGWAICLRQWKIESMKFCFTSAQLSSHFANFFAVFFSWEFRRSFCAGNHGVRIPMIVLITANK
jgi:hypothetical protein